MRYVVCCPFVVQSIVSVSFQVVFVWQVFVAELKSGVEECVAQSLHGRSQVDIAKVPFDYFIEVFIQWKNGEYISLISACDT